MSELKERRGNQHAIISNSAIFGFDYIRPDDVILESASITRVVQAATQLYHPCYIETNEPGRYIEYAPHSIRRLTIAEMEAMGKWFIPREQ